MRVSISFFPENKCQRKTFLGRARRWGLAKTRQNQTLHAVGPSLLSLHGCSSETPFLKVTLWAGCWSQTSQSEVLLPWTHCGMTEICFSSILLTRYCFKIYLLCYFCWSILSPGWKLRQGNTFFKLCTLGIALPCLCLGILVKSSNNSNDNSSSRERCSRWDPNLRQSRARWSWESADAAAAHVPFPGNVKKLHTSSTSRLAGCAGQFCHQRQSQRCILYTYVFMCTCVLCIYWNVHFCRCMCMPVCV